MPLTNAQRQAKWRESQKRKVAQGDQNKLVEKLVKLYGRRAVQIRRLSNRRDAPDYTPEDYLVSQLREDADYRFVSVLMEMLTGSPKLPPRFKPKILGGNEKAPHQY